MAQMWVETCPICCKDLVMMIIIIIIIIIMIMMMIMIIIIKNSRLYSGYILMLIQ